MSIQTRTQILCGLMLTAALAAPAKAAPIAYVETNGSLNTYPGVSVGTFDIGVNTVSGTVSGAAGGGAGGPGGGNYADAYTFNLPSGYEIVAATATITNFTYGVGASPSNGTFILNGSAGSDGTTTISGNGTTVNFLTTPVSDPSSFSVTTLSSSSSTSSGRGQPTFYVGGYSYTESFTVQQIGGGTAVPEPGSILLLLSAGLGLTMVRGRSRSNRAG